MGAGRGITVSMYRVSIGTARKSIGFERFGSVADRAPEQSDERVRDAAGGHGGEDVGGESRLAPCGRAGEAMQLSMHGAVTLCGLPLEHAESRAVAGLLEHREDEVRARRADHLVLEVAIRCEESSRAELVAG